MDGPWLADPTLAMCADVVDDLERVRIANENRLRTLTAVDEYGHGLTIDHPDVKRLAALVNTLQAAEHQAVLNMGRVMRHHPLGPWMAARPGIGEKQFARLLAAIGDPYWNDLKDEPRTVRQLYAYCGMHVLDLGAQIRHASQATGGADQNPAQGRSDGQKPNGGDGDTGAQDVAEKSHEYRGAGVAPTHQRGEKANWNTTARTRLWLIADKCIQITNSPYRPLYDTGRTKYTHAIHPSPCKRCGPKNNPAETGTPLSPGHQHARARRLIMKAILKDLWTEAKQLHKAPKG